jgi:hypothetical protein
MILTQTILSNLFDYNNGQLFWKNPTNRCKKNPLAGCLGSHKYWQIRIKNKTYLAHRLIYLLMHGQMPKQIDHIDGNKLNNQIQNLRPSNQSENRMNSRPSSKNKIGIKGVCWSKVHKKWRVQVKKQGINLCDKFFDDLELAQLVAVEARNEHHGKFARHK